MEEKCLEIHNQIQPKIIGIAGRTPAQFDSKDAFLLMGSMLMVQHIRIKEPEAFRLMVRDIDDAVKPSEVSLRAKSYIDKIGQGEPSGILSENNGTFLASKEDRKKSDCKTWKSSGSCRYGKNAIIDTLSVIKEDRLRLNLNHQIQRWTKMNNIHNQIHRLKKKKETLARNQSRKNIPANTMHILLNFQARFIIHTSVINEIWKIQMANHIMLGTTESSLKKPNMSVLVKKYLLEKTSKTLDTKIAAQKCSNN